MDHPRRELKYVDARALNGFAARLDGADVRGADGEKLGVVEGFVMDVQQGRPRHVVVAAGWFIHKHFLVPIGHVTLSPDGTSLSADIVKERVEGFPGFNKGEFEKLEGDDFEKLDHMMATMTSNVAVTDLQSHYRLPDGWENSQR
jgi:hypothetical protein